MYLIIFRKRCLLPLGVLILVFFSCNKDVLKETPLDFLAPEVAYSSLAGIQQGIYGLYTTVRANWYYGINDDCTQMYGMGTDLAYMGDDPGTSRFLTDYSTFLIPSNPYVSGFWKLNYQFLQRVNSLIYGIDISDDIVWEGNVKKRDSYLAEAKFFRAFAYRILVSFYGDVPLVVAPITSAKVDFGRTPKEEIFELMEDDLTFATTNLPNPGEEEATGRLTQGAAWHMLGELYLTEGKYQLAVDALSKVIESYNYSLMTTRFGTRLGNDIFGSGDVYFDLFGYGNQSLPGNSEAIWVIQYEPLTVGGSQNPGERIFGPAYFRMGNTPDGFKAFRGEFVGGNYTGYSDTLGRPVAWMRPTNYLSYDIWESDWDNDIRNAKHNIKRDFYYDSPGSIYDKKKIDFTLYPPGDRTPIKDTCQYIFPYFMKFADPMHHFTDAATSGGGYTHKDIYAIRLAETLLLRAEAYVRLNNFEAAANDINRIRNRAHAKPVFGSDVDLDYILDERARELYGEDWRPITLRRMGKLLERVRKYNNNPVFPGANIQDFNVLYPIPQQEFDLNIEGTLQQNPGY